MSYAIVNNLQIWTQTVRFLKLNYLIQRNNQCSLYEYSETYKSSLLQNVKFLNVATGGTYMYH
jgi:hypothetical protein